MYYFENWWGGGVGCNMNFTLTWIRLKLFLNVLVTAHH